MRTIRLYVDAPLAGAASLALPEAAAHHAARVLRLATGQSITLFNGDGCDYAGTIEWVAGAAVAVRVHGQCVVDNEAPVPVTLAQCLARGEKMDFVMQKATELGVAAIVPIVSERSEVRLDAPRGDKRMMHWRSVVSAACEQCGRARLPRVAVPQTLDAWLATLPSDGALRLALLPSAATHVRDLQLRAAGVILVIGPEGGLGERDVAALEGAGFRGLGLGPRILRTETAGLAALAAIAACHGDA